MKNKLTAIQDFEWPVFKSEGERIKYNSKLYKERDITEAFELCYGLKLNPSPMVNIVPNDLNIGDIISTRILNLTKEDVLFDSLNYKTSFQSTIHFGRYKNFKYNPNHMIDVKVTRIEKELVYVDPIAPTFDNWLEPILKNPNIQKVLNEPQTIKVKDLKLSRGGFIGKAVIPCISELVGEDYMIEAFIPGSQIVLNIPENFEKYDGITVDAFVVNYIEKQDTTTGKSKMSLICSAKEYLKFLGDKHLINFFKAWCEENDYWKEVSQMVFKGEVTGVINSSKKCGVFIEIPELNITGMVPVKPEQLVNYKPHNEINVKFVGFDEKTYFNEEVGQIQHVEPYDIKEGVLNKCNLKPILQFV